MAARQVDRSQNAKVIARILKEEGFSERAIRASLARMKQESNFNPLALNKNDGGKGKHSRGIFQWNRERLDALERFAGKYGGRDSLEAQARFYAQEVKGKIGGEGAYGRRLLAAQTDEDAAKAAISLARPKGWKRNAPERGHGFQNTLRWTKDLDVKAMGDLTLYANVRGATGTKEVPVSTESNISELLRGTLDATGKPKESGEKISPALDFDVIQKGLQTGTEDLSIGTGESVPGVERDTAPEPLGPGNPILEALTGVASALSEVGVEGAFGGKTKRKRGPSMLRQEMSGGASRSPSVASIINSIRV